jgi:hypothetical protein
MRNPAPRLRAPAGAHQGGQASFAHRWQLLSARGNKAFERGEWDAAERHYGDALGLARVAITLARRAGDRVQDDELEHWLSMWVISHLNLSELHARSGQPERALEVAFSAYERIVECLHDVNVAARVHRACLRHLRHVLDGLADFMKRFGIPEDSTQRIFARAQSLALGYWNAWA